MTRATCSAILVLALLTSGCRREQAQSVSPVATILSPSLIAKSQVPTGLEASCGECHGHQFESWQESQHALANRLIDSSLDRMAFEGGQEINTGKTRTRVTLLNGAPAFAVTTAEGKHAFHQPEAVIGIEPLIQYLVPVGDGRLQAMDAAYNTQSHEWFHVFDGEERFEHEWGHWKTRGMNWNVQCATCHMTGFEKNYDHASDAYASTWDAMGISCRQCHGDQATHAANPYMDQWEDVSPAMDRVDHMQVCATCHSRREELTGQFKPGDGFDDHYRLSLVTDGNLYYADGQVREEDYEYGSFMLSRLALKGVTCMNCHDAHSGKLLMPVSDNSLCMTCHAAPGWNGAVVIDPLAHSHHQDGSAGNRCVDCHMPVTRYMVHDPRRDHGFTVPDPQLTKELGIPNACNRCHTEETSDWAIEWSEKWYGEKLANRRSRKRARLIERVRNGDHSNVDAMIEMAREEEIPAWRAGLIGLFDPRELDTADGQFLKQSLDHESPIVRAAAIRGLAPVPGSYPLLHPLRKDPVRLVRLDASWATLHPSFRESASNTDLMTYLNHISDQPAGALRQAQLAITERRMEDAVQWADRAAKWDPSAAAVHMKGRVYHAAGRLPEAETALQEAVKLDPRVAEHHYALALLEAEMKHPQKALQALKATVKVDPEFGRAWYNLGLGHAALEQLEEAVNALLKAEALMTDSPDAAYARATVHLRQNDHARAREAIHASLKIQPDFAPALQIQRGLDTQN